MMLLFFIDFMCDQRVKPNASPSTNIKRNAIMNKLNKYATIVRRRCGWRKK